MSRQEKQQENVPQKISSSLLENLVYLRKQFDGSMDFIIRQFNIEGTKAALITIDNLIDKQTIAESILNPIRRAELSHLNGMEKMKEIRDNILTTVDQEQMVEFDTLLTKLMSGFAMLAIDGCDFMLSIGVQSFD